MKKGGGGTRHPHTYKKTLILKSAWIFVLVKSKKSFSTLPERNESI